MISRGRTHVNPDSHGMTIARWSFARSGGATCNIICTDYRALRGGQALCPEITQAYIVIMSDLQDYDLNKPIAGTGLRQGLTSYGDTHFSLFLRKVFIKAAGYGEDALTRPIIGIINTGSGFNPCHANVPQLMEAVKRGVQLAGGLAIEFPTISLHESFASPTSMFLRNLMSMDTEEMIKAQPVDVCIMIGGCDKTVPAQLMGGISANKPVLPLITGPMMPGSFKGQRIGACTDCRSNWAAYRAGDLDIEDINGINEELAPTVSGFMISQLMQAL